MAKTRVVAVLCTTLVTFGCSDMEKPSTPLTSDVPARSAAEAVRNERVALDQLTRAVAVALQDAGLRHRVKADMRASRATHEHKLEFSSYIQGQSGGILLAKMVQQTGMSRTEILGLLGRVRPLEFYMPVQAQRESWQGGDDLLVGSLIDDHETPTVYTLAGQPVRVAADAVPPLPTLALVPVETNFRSTLDRRYKNRNDQGGETIGTLMMVEPVEPCSGDLYTVEDPCGEPYDPGPYVSPWASRATGIYATRINIDGDFEGAFKGNPEFEIHLQAPVGDPATAEDIRCAGESAPDPRSVFNYDNATDNYSGAILVADSAQQAQFRARYGESVGMNFVVWEDDDTRCTIKVEQSRFTNMMNTIEANYPAINAAIQDPNNETILKALPALKKIAVAVASWLQSNDELVGSAVNMACSRDNTPFSHDIKDGTNSNGCINLVAHDQSTY